MPGTRDKNLRSGDLHEELGILLLKGIAVVAPVPRQEDVGNDAFATLLKQAGNRKLIADISFLVQFKSSSVTCLTFSKKDELEWLYALEIPLFIGRVSFSTASIELYTTINLQQVILEFGYSQITVLFNDSNVRSDKAGERTINLGEPIHTWSIYDLCSDGFYENYFAVIQPHVEMLRRNINLRRVHTLEQLSWKTGEPPKIFSHLIQTQAESNVQDTLEALVPLVRRLFFEVSVSDRYEALPTLNAFCDLITRWGVHPDKLGCFRQILELDAMQIAHAEPVWHI
ncbi:MAG: hypothetical protein SFX18_12335 [Pirellulales bacterium]|nr:hypothetical protein [Pirellulales bacterium]